VTWIVELVVALLCIALAGLLVIRLFDQQRGSGRKQE
jgi:hypothetical protein